MSEQRGREYGEAWDAELEGAAGDPLVEPADESPELAAEVEEELLMPDPAIEEEELPPYGGAYEPPS